MSLKDFWRSEAFEEIHGMKYPRKEWCTNLKSDPFTTPSNGNHVKNRNLDRPRQCHPFSKYLRSIWHR